MDSERDIATPQRRRIHTVLVLVSADTDLELADRLSEVLALGESRGAFTDTFANAVVLMFGILGADPQSSCDTAAPSDLLRELHARFERDVAVLYGDCEAIVGSTITANSARFHVQVDQLDQMIDRLRSLSTGQFVPFTEQGAA